MEFDNHPAYMSIVLSSEWLFHKLFISSRAKPPITDSFMMVKQHEEWITADGKKYEREINHTIDRMVNAWRWRTHNMECLGLTQSICSHSVLSSTCVVRSLVCWYLNVRSLQLTCPNVRFFSEWTNYYVRSSPSNILHTCSKHWPERNKTKRW